MYVVWKLHWSPFGFFFILFLLAVTSGRPHPVSISAPLWYVRTSISSRIESSIFWLKSDFKVQSSSRLLRGGYLLGLTGQYFVWRLRTIDCVHITPNSNHHVHLRYLNYISQSKTNLNLSVTGVTLARPPPNKPDGTIPLILHHVWPPLYNDRFPLPPSDHCRGVDISSSSSVFQNFEVTSTAVTHS